MKVKDMSTTGIDSILTRVEKLSIEEKRLLVKRVIDSLGAAAERPKRRASLAKRKQRKHTHRLSQESALSHAIAAYARRHGGGPGNVDLDVELEAASAEFLLTNEGQHL